jgi:hypothetical protein
VTKWAESGYPIIRKVFQRQLDLQSAGNIRRFNTKGIVNEEPVWLLGLFLCYRNGGQCLSVYVGSSGFTEAKAHDMLKL